MGSKLPITEDFLRRLEEDSIKLEKYSRGCRGVKMFK
jgi:hypothetical protein